MSNPLFDKIIVEGLFGKPYLNYALPFEHERKWLIINASNGQGKTTLLRALFHYLSGQWEQITNGNLSKIFMESNGTIKAIYRPSRKVPNGRIEASIQGYYYDKYRDMRPALGELFSYTIGELQSNTSLIQELVARHGIHQSKFSAVYTEILRGVLSIKQTPLEKIRILFLPTYRRIERTNQEVFPNFIDYLTTRLMDNVDALKRKPKEEDREDTKDLSESGLDGIETYGAAAIRGIDKELDDYGKEKQNTESTEDAHIVYNRGQVETAIGQYWEDYHKTEITIGHDGKVEHQLLVGFGMNDIEQKIENFSLLAQRESWAKKRIEQWRDICNKCFFREHKTLHYFAPSHKVYVACNRDEGNIHSLNILSSGEKQIAALFAHVLFSRFPVFLILDEPELSLSEPWQKTMMDELTKLPNLGGMLIASHSSKILNYDNRRYTKSLDDLRSSNAY